MAVNEPKAVPGQLPPELKQEYDRLRLVKSLAGLIPNERIANIFNTLADQELARLEPLIMNPTKIEARQQYIQQITPEEIKARIAEIEQTAVPEAQAAAVRTQAVSAAEFPFQLALLSARASLRPGRATKPEKLTAASATAVVNQLKATKKDDLSDLKVEVFPLATGQRFKEFQNRFLSGDIPLANVKDIALRAGITPRTAYEWAQSVSGRITSGKAPAPALSVSQVVKSHITRFGGNITAARMDFGKHIEDTFDRQVYAELKRLEKATRGIPRWF